MLHYHAAIKNTRSCKTNSSKTLTSSEFNGSKEVSGILSGIVSYPMSAASVKEGTCNITVVNGNVQHYHALKKNNASIVHKKYKYTPNETPQY